MSNQSSNEQTPRAEWSVESSADDDSLLNALLDELVTRIESGSDLQLDQLCSKYPQYAQSLRRSANALLMLVDAGQPKSDQRADGNRFRRETLGALLDGSIGNGPAHDWVGRTIDQYKIREKLGEGGFGVVHVAEQLKPVRRKVAIKVIKLGMDSHEVLARFDAERQALAMMDHPNIAKIFDGGLTEDGRPYFAMELVRGVPLTQFCKHQKLSLSGRLELFRDICKAVQHAHHKGIIHRDLKPKNVLVTMRDDIPTVKVIDFGVAKALHTRLTDQSIYTSFGQMVGTPLYMSPEQIQLNEFDVDTRSDVYSLGVILYELMTGALPFSRETLRDEGLDSFRRLVCDSDPPRPSQRMSGQRDGAHVVDERGVPESPQIAIPGELDWIVMKALEKNRTRRYQSAGNLADDIERFINGDPVEACPPSIGYRLRKYVQRNRWQISAVTALFVVLVSGIAATAYQAIRATHAEHDARELAETAEEKSAMAIAAEAEARLQAEKAIAEKERADERTEFARNAVDRMYVEFAFEWLGRDAKLTDLQREFLESAMEFYGQLSRDELETPAAQHAAAVASYYYGSILLKFRRWEEADAEFERAYSIFESLARSGQFPSFGSLFERGPTDRVVINSRQSFDFEQRMLRHPIGSLIMALRRRALIPDANVLELIGQTAGHAEELGREFPEESLLTHQRCVIARTYAHSLIVSGFHEQAIEQIRRAEALFERVKPLLGEDNYFAKREEVWVLVTRYEIHRHLNEFEQAESALLRADSLVRQALLAYPEMEGYARDRVRIKRMLAEHYERQRRAQDAERYRLGFSDAYLALANLAPYDSSTLNNAAWFLLIRDDITLAEVSQALDLVKRSLEREPDSSTMHNTMGLALFRNGMLDESIHHFHEALRLDQTVKTKRLNHALLAIVYNKQGNIDRALQSATIAKQLTDAGPIDPCEQGFLTKAISLLPAEQRGSEP